MRAAGLLLSLCLLSGTVHAEIDVEKLIDELGEPTQASNAYMQLRNAKDARAIPLLVKVLPGYPIISQYYGTMILVNYGWKIAKAPLRALARAESAHLRLVAGVGLYRIGDRAGVKVIVTALRAGGIDDNLRTTMFSRIYSVYSGEVAAVVRGSLETGGPQTLISAALYYLYTVRDAGSDDAAARLVGEDPRPSVKALAAAYLYRRGQEQYGAYLAKALATGDVGYAAFSRIRTWLGMRPTVSEEILEALAGQLGKAKQTFHITGIIEILAKHGYAKAVPQFKKLLDHKNNQVAKAAFEALTELSGALNAETLRPLLDAKDKGRRIWAAEALRRMDDMTGLPLVLDVLETGSNQERADAAKALGGFRAAATVDPLIDALMDPYMSVRSYALSSLGSVFRSLYPYRSLRLVDTGYLSNAPEETRKAAVKMIRAWWKANRAKDW